MVMNDDPRRQAGEGASVLATGAQGDGQAGNGQVRDSPQDAAIREAFDIADGLFREAAADFTHLRKRLRGSGRGAGGKGKSGKAAPVAGDGLQDGLKDAVKLARELRAATQLMLEERNRIDRFRKEIAGGVGGGALDLDAARDEIGRRLACLRRAGGG